MCAFTCSRGDDETRSKDNGHADMRTKMQQDCVHENGFLVGELAVVAAVDFV